MSSTTASRYRSLKIEEPDDEVVFDADHYATVSNQAESSRCFLLLALLSTLLLVLGFSTGIFFCQFRAPRSTITEKLLNAHTFSSQAHHPAISSQPKLCQKVSTRREWRTLSGREKQDYISAVQCFTATPSGLRQEGTLYDDFSSVHSEYANTTHQAPQFFPWHRRFIQVYEDTLRDRCGYQGSLPYWDWSLDWENLSSAPVWSNTTGFGGNGGGDMVDLGKKKAFGHCMIDGPFAGLQPLFQGSERQQHCLSRGLRSFPGEAMRPDAIEAIMCETSFEHFFLDVERKLHDVVPSLVRGDFMLFTAPNDPVFYLHHAQLDRLWWIWQQRDLPRRYKDYSGSAGPDSTLKVSLQDKLAISGLGEEVSVADVVDTTREPFCYVY